MLTRSAEADQTGATDTRVRPTRSRSRGARMETPSERADDRCMVGNTDNANLRAHPRRSGDRLRYAVRSGAGPLSTGRRYSHVPRPIEQALESLTSDGRSHVGSINDVRCYGFSWDIWFHVDTAESARRSAARPLAMSGIHFLNRLTTSLRGCTFRLRHTDGSNP
jgi:hypothetical protein